MRTVLVPPEEFQRRWDEIDAELEGMRKQREFLFAWLVSEMGPERLTI
ncbi:hypothetical protein ACYFX5_11705 [Bremerella sp. T1]|nr:hypothetical protein [Bremerella volcania]UBM33737.1 hypothetical protein LA756_13650 [Bremerella volcania]